MFHLVLVRQQLFKLFHRHGTVEIIALGKVGVHLNQHILLPFRLHAFGDNGHAQILGHGHNGADQIHAPFVVIVVPRQELHIRLQHVHVHGVQHAQGRRPAAEIVHQHMEPVLPHPLDGIQDGIHVIRQGAFRNLYTDHGRIQLVLLHQIDEMLRNVRKIEIHPGHVDRNGNGLNAPLLHIAEPLRHILPHGAVNLVNIACLLQNRDELHRRDQLALVHPAHQRLTADDLAVADQHLGLHIKDELVVAQAVLYIQDHHLVFLLVVVGLLAVEMIPLQELAFDVVQRAQRPVVHGRHRLPAVRGEVDAQHGGEAFRTVQHAVDGVRFRHKVTVVLLLRRNKGAEGIAARISADAVVPFRDLVHRRSQILQVGVARLPSENIVV